MLVIPFTNLAVKTQGYKHEKKDNRPELWRGKLAKSCWIHDEHQSGTLKRKERMTMYQASARDYLKVFWLKGVTEHLHDVDIVF